VFSLEGYIEDLIGGIAFSEPDEEVHRFANQQTRETAAILFGCGLYDGVEEFWAAPERADRGEVEAEFARAHAATPRIVFSVNGQAPVSTEINRRGPPRQPRPGTAPPRSATAVNRCRPGRGATCCWPRYPHRSATPSPST
jgi:hypothetical protein